ncbi:response regulator [Methylotuvimicrobium sp. KM2]|uniref:response regulator n=1 Tax=Methylotuvimicrobium sp. KM2 TaxID=3133976 RepID=UPI0031016A4F
MNNKPTVLFMDDEPANEIIVNARERMQEHGFEVDFVCTMSSAIEAYYQKYYDVFILDIDMSHLPDDQEGDGVKVLKRFISLHNQTKVIMFSGAGTVQHWFAAANAHCFAYIAKDQQEGEKDAIDLLIDAIQAAADETGKPPVRSVAQSTPQCALLIGQDPALLAQAQNVLSDTLGASWSTQTTAPEALTETLSDESKFGLIAWIQHEFSTKAKVKDQLKYMLDKAPTPQTIIACDGNDKYRPIILYMANRHPFRMLDLQHPQWQREFAEALKKAADWYGNTEIVNIDPDALSRIHITLPEDIADVWSEPLSEEELDDLYSDYEADMHDDEANDPRSES